MFRNQVRRVREGLLDRIIDEQLTLPCRTHGSDLWFAETAAGADEAKRLCASCPIRVECLAGALLRGEPWGVWGGEIFEKGHIVPHKRPRGRPPRTQPSRAA
jgi:WhiB family transcriptional regulator, redox-sensing transcriptional regulator